MTREVITPEKFEEARLAFVRAWEARDTLNTALHCDNPGERTTYGLLAALDVLGITLVEG